MSLMTFGRRGIRGGLIVSPVGSSGGSVFLPEKISGYMSNGEVARAQAARMNGGNMLRAPRIPRPMMQLRKKK